MSSLSIKNVLAPHEITKMTKEKATSTSFSDLLKEELWKNPRDHIMQAENLASQAALNPGANKLQLVAALTEAEIELQKITTIFTKAHDAYDKILHMQL